LTEHGDVCLYIHHLHGNWKQEDHKFKASPSSYPMSRQNTRPTAMNIWANICLLSNTMSIVVRNSTSTLPLPSPTWTLRILHLKEHRWLNFLTNNWITDVPIWSLETQEIWKNQVTKLNNSMITRSNDSKSGWNSKEFKRMVIRLVKEIKYDMNKNLN
jgi:hypothetical protein